MSTDEEKQKLLSSALIAAGIVVILWVVKAIEAAFGISLVSFGIQPLTAEGLKGIIFSPLIHGSMAHLISNSVPFFLLAAAFVLLLQDTCLDHLFTFLAGYRVLDMDICQRIIISYRGKWCGIRIGYFPFRKRNNKERA